MNYEDYLSQTGGINDEKLGQIEVNAPDEDEGETGTKKTNREEMQWKAKKLEDLNEIKKFKEIIKDIMTTSNLVSKYFNDSARYMEKTVDKVTNPVKTLIAEVDRLNRFNENFEKTFPELQELCRLIYIVDGDKLRIRDGPKTTIGEYIDKLVQIKNFDRFAWINTIEYAQVKDLFTREKTIKSIYVSYLDLMNKGESILVREFVGALDFYSSDSRILQFYEYLINEFNERELLDGIKTTLIDIETPDVFKPSIEKPFLFLSNETVFKMAKICSWFLEREHESELFDECRESHMGIDEKLKYAKLRFEFLKKALIIHSKMTSLGYKRDLNESFKKNFRKILDSLPTSKSLINQLAFSKNEALNVATKRPLSNNRNALGLNIVSSNIRCIGININSSSDSPEMILEFEDVPITDTSQSKPIDYLDLYFEDLDFNLRLLSHEIGMIDILFHRSVDTRSQMISHLKNLFIEVVHKEFERFFDQKLELGKIMPISHDVMVRVILLLIRIYRIKEKLGENRFDDIETCARLLKFVMRTSEICAPVFYNYIDTIKQPIECEIPENLGVHPKVDEVCTVLQLISTNEMAVASAIVQSRFLNATSAEFFEKERWNRTSKLNSGGQIEDKSSALDALSKIKEKTITKLVYLDFK